MNVPTTGRKTPVDDLRSHHFKPADMGWVKTRFAGCEMKPLLVDGKSGLATLLIRMAPGAELPDHEHVLIEQTYVLEGSLVDKEGPDAGTEVKAGEFVWRPAGSRHSAWAPKGGTFLAHIPDPEQVLREGRPRARFRRQGLGSGLEVVTSEIA